MRDTTSVLWAADRPGTDAGGWGPSWRCWTRAKWRSWPGARISPI